MNRPPRAWTRRQCLAAAALAPLARHAHAAVPADYQALVPAATVEPATGHWHFDLRPAQARARQLGRDLYVYLGASDCPYCRRYEAFLAEHARELVPHFLARYLVVELRSELSVTAARLHLRTDAHHLPYADFQRAIGDERARLLVYPSVWLLRADGRPLMQMPAGTGTFQTVAEQLEVLRLEQ